MTAILKAALMYAVAAIAGWRLLKGVGRVRTRAMPVTRLFAPALLFAGSVCVAVHWIPKSVVIAVAIVVEAFIEVSVIVIAVRIARSREGALEQRLAEAFAPLYAPAFGRYIAMEFTVMWNAWCGMRTAFAPPRGSADTYVEKNMLGMLGLVLLVGAIPEIPLHHLLLAREPWWSAAILDFLVLYAAAWVFGLYGTMARRPHELGADRIVFHRGPLGCAEVERSAVRDATALVAPNARAIRQKHRNAYLGLPGSDLVHLRLETPARVVRTFPVRRECSVSELFVASDRPHELCALLAAAR